MANLTDLNPYSWIDRALETIKRANWSRSTQLITRHKQLHQDLERAIATLKGTEAALVFSSGYLANLGTIAALVGKKDLILSDRSNHSGLKNGSLLSGVCRRLDSCLARCAHSERRQSCPLLLRVNLVVISNC